jgi:glucokinase
MRRCVAGIDVGGTKVHVAIFDSDGRIVGERVSPSDPSAPTTVLRALDDLAELYTEFEIDGLDAVAVAVPGVVNGERVLFAPNLTDWEARDPISLVRGSRIYVIAKIGHVGLVNDVRAAALAELDDGALSGCQSGLYINLGTGISAALVIGGQLYSGAHGAAGEIGFNLHQPNDDVDPDRGIAPLEQLVGGRAVARVAHGASADNGSTHDHRVSDNWAAAVDGVIDVIAMHIANLAIALDPEVVVVGGGLMRSSDTILPRLAARVGAATPSHVAVRGAAYVNDAPVRGAGIVARQLAQRSQ